MSFTECLTNNWPLWKVYWYMMARSLIRIYKHPVVIPVGVRETCRQMMVKCVLVVAGPEAKESHRMEQLCGGMEANIK